MLGRYFPSQRCFQAPDAFPAELRRRERPNIASGELTVGTKDRHPREHKCLADFAEGDAFRCLMQRGLEALDRFAEVFGTEAESLMMDRHDEVSAGFIGHLHRLFRSTVRINPRIVSADRHDRQIDGTGAGSAQLRKRSGQGGVATVPYKMMYDAAV